VDMCLMLAVSGADATWAETIVTWTWMILGVAGGLTFVIFVHELGHFLVAKACGVKCEKFYVGFDFFEIPIPFTKWKIPRSLFKFQWGETEYGIGSLPLGGYVKMLGQDDDPRNADNEAARIRVSQDAVEHAAQEGEAPVTGQTVEGKKIMLDPRSFPAKSVPARMAIISAGVIMNLIFGVIMATVAFKLGVKEMPAMIGVTTPGGAAWTDGLKPGSKLLQVGQRGKSYEYLSFSHFRAMAILNNGRAVKILMRQPDGQEVWHELTPTKKPDAKQPLIGIAPAADTKLNIWPEFASFRNPKSSPPLRDYDVVLAVNGQKVASGTDLYTILAQQPKGPVKLKVERSERTKDGDLVEEPKQPPQIIETTLAERPLRELGLTMKIGPIVAIRERSPAIDAGFRVDDVLVEVNGQPVGDPLSLSQRLTPEVGSSSTYSFVVERKDSQGRVIRRTLQVVPERPLQSPLQASAVLVSNPVAIESVGIAFNVTNEVAGVDPSGPASAAGMKAGDVLTKAQFAVELDAKARGKLDSLQGFKIADEMELAAGKSSWSEVFARLQIIPPQSKLKLDFSRGKEAKSATIVWRSSADFFDDMRGLDTYTLTFTHTAKDWGEAAQLGFRETYERVKEVIVILHSLVTGWLSPTNLSGPPGILMAAAGFASEGFASLLMFLVILSANLAVINFLPIPALDGGHMLFLTAEGIRGKPVDERLQIRLTIAGVICLLMLMVFATAMDIGRFAEMIRGWF